MLNGTKVEHNLIFRPQVVSQNYISIPLYFRIFILYTSVISDNQ